MGPPQRLLLILAVALLAAGGVGAALHRPVARSAPAPVRTSTSATTAGPPTSVPVTVTTTGGPPPADSATLGADLITPTDMGGYYHVVPAAAASLLDSAPCLAPLQPSPAQSGRAAEALLGPDRYSVPTIVEEVASYPPTSARSVFRSVVTAIGACPALSMSFGGRAVTARLQASSLAAVGDADQAWSGGFAYGGAPFSVQLGVVLDGTDVLAVMWIDTVPQSDPVMGSFPSTVSLAIGKLA